MKPGSAVSAILAMVLAAGLNLGGTGAAAAEPSTEKAARFVESLGGEAVALLKSDTAMVPEKRQAALRDLIRSGFNLELTSQFVLGKHWARATPEQRTQFQDLFTEYLLNSYARHLGAVRAETLIVVASHAVGEKDVLVETSVESAEGTTRPVWRVRAQDEQYKIIDVSVDGVSMALTQRREFASVVNRVGLDGLLQMLREKLSAQAKAVRWDPANQGSHMSLLASILASPNANRLDLYLAGR